jgi:bifunctional polynucleotide phosphatase/kinase
MAPKRKLKPDEDNTSDEEVLPTSNVTKKGRQTNPVMASLSKSKLKHDLEWSHIELDGKGIPALYYLWSKNLSGCKKIAGFDIDGTVIVTKTGKSFAANASDWKWFDKKVPEKLKELDSQGYRIVFITNQAGIEKKKTSFTELKTKFEAMITELDIPIYIFIATGENHFRKPSTEMWNFFAEKCNKSEEIDMKESFYVGDAAGRPKNWYLYNL